MTAFITYMDVTASRDNLVALPASAGRCGVEVVEYEIDDVDETTWVFTRLVSFGDVRV